MPHPLTRFISGSGKAHTVDNAVQTTLQHLKELFARNSLFPGHPVEIPSELSFQDAVNPLHFLLFPTLRLIFRSFCPFLTVLSRRIIPPVDGTLLRQTTVAFQK
jgi:hypothetical protein